MILLLYKYQLKCQISTFIKNVNPCWYMNNPNSSRDPRESLAPVKYPFLNIELCTTT